MTGFSQPVGNFSDMGRADFAAPADDRSALFNPCHGVERNLMGGKGVRVFLGLPPQEMMLGGV